MTGRPLAHNLSTVATIAQRRAALATAIGLVCVAVAAAPFGSRPGPHLDAIVPAIGSAAIVAMIVSAMMLRNQYQTTRFVPLAVLSTAYWITGLLLVPSLLFTKGVFSPTAFGLGAQAAPWMWIVWHAAFVMLAAGYVWSESYFSRSAVDSEDGAAFARCYALGATVIAAAAVAVLVTSHQYLPILIAPGGYTLTYHLLVGQLLLTSASIVMATMIARNALRQTSNLWLCVVLLAYALEIVLHGDVIAEPFTIAWYAGFGIGALWQTMFLFVQLRHANEQLAAYAADTRTLVEETKRDALTNLFNRRGFEDRFELALTTSRAARGSIALLTLDLDHFKAYNDHFGHLAGDDALRQIAGAIMAAVNRPADACCRVGGEEFAIILAETDEAGAQTVAERVRIAVLRLRIRHAPEIALPAMTVSVGIAVAPADAVSSVQTLYERADQALYRAKRLGRNCVVSADGPREGALRIV